MSKRELFTSFMIGCFMLGYFSGKAEIPAPITRAVVAGIFLGVILMSIGIILEKFK